MCEGIWGQHRPMLSLPPVQERLMMRPPSAIQTNGGSFKYNRDQHHPLNIIQTDGEALRFNVESLKYNTDQCQTQQHNTDQCWAPQIQQRLVLSSSGTIQIDSEPLKHNTDKCWSPQTQPRSMLNPLNITQTKAKLISIRQTNAEPLKHNTDQCQTP